MANERPTGKEEEEEEAAGQSVESGRSIESPVTPNRAVTVPLQKIAAKHPGQTTSSHHPAVSPSTDEPSAMMVMNGNRLIAVHPYPQVRPLFAPGFGPVNFFQPLLAGQGHAVHIVRDRQMPILLPKGLIATAIPPPNAEIQATEDDLVQLPDGSFTFSDEFNQRLRDAGSRQVIVTAPHGAQMGYQQAPLMGAPSSIAIGSNGSNGGHPETAHNGGGPPPADPVVTQPAAQPQGVSVGIDDANVTSQPVTGTQESNGATKKESNGTKKEKEEKMEGGALPTQTTGQDQSGSGEASAEAPVGEKQDNNGGAKTEKKKGEGSEGKAGSSRPNVRKPSEDQGKKKKEGGQNGVGTTSDISTQSSRKSKAGGSVDSRPSTAQTTADESDQILDALGADEGAQKQKRKRSRGAKNYKEAAVPKRVKIEDDAEENPINNVNDAETSMPINETGSAISQAAVVWMKNRLEMDIPLAERKHKETSETPKASSSAEGAESSRKRGKRPGSELQQLLSMDFGPRENSRRSREVLPVVIHTAETAKTRAQMLQETPGSNSRVSRRGTSRSSTSSSAEKVKRTFRHRDATTKCAICGQSFDQNAVAFALSGHCSEACYNITAGALEDDSGTERSTPEMSEDYVRKDSSTPSKEEAKEEPVSPPNRRPTSAPKKRGRKAKTAEQGETPKTDNTSKEEKIGEEQRPKNRNRKRVVVKKEEETDEEEEQEEEEEEEEPVAKTSKVEAATPPPVVAVTPAAAAAAIPQAAAPAGEMDRATLARMTIPQVRDWAEKVLGNSEAAQKFFDEDIDGAVLIEMNYKDLKDDLKLTIGHAKRVQNELEKYQKK